MNERKREEPPQRLPPPVMGRRKKSSAKAKRLPWYRHTAWVIPLGACVVFTVLIAGGLVVRQVIIVIRGDITPVDVTDGSNDGKNDNGASPSGVASADAGSTDEPRLALESSEPGYEVLPPKAAKEPGRKLRKMLLVGRHPDMFPTLEAAIEVAIPGDIIEVRTNVTLPTGACILKLEQRSNDPVTIRAGNGYSPVLRWTGGVGIQAEKVDVQLLGLHFVPPPSKLIKLSEANLEMRQCTVTAKRATDCVTVEEREGFATQVRMQDCLINMSNRYLLNAPYSVNAEFRNCVIRSRFALVNFGDAKMLASPLPGRITFIQNTIEMDWLIYRLPRGRAEFEAERNVFSSNLIQINSNPSVLPESADAAATNWPRTINNHMKWRGQNNVYWPRRWDYGWVVAFDFANEKSRWNKLVRDYGEWQQLWGVQNEAGGLIEQPLFALTPEQKKQLKGPMIPAHFVLQPVGQIGAAMQSGLQVGCDVSKLPIPPVETIAP